MKCPGCGADMEEGALYCEKCGAEIHIVPDFEPELEEAYEQTIDHITNDIWENETASESTPDIREIKKNKKKAGMVAGIVLTVIVLLSVSAGMVYYAWNHSVEFQTNRARKFAAAENYERAAKYYEHAIELDPNRVDLKVELADAYFYRNNKIEYEYILWDIIRDKNATQEQIESAYGKLIAIYRSREDYQEINDFLLASGNDGVMSTYQMYIAREPEFSLKEGTYTGMQPLKLTASGEGTIYYTLDGSDPDEESIPYTIPIILDNGENTVKAYFVNSNGIYSDIVEKKYVIEIDEIPEPRISLPSGKYVVPMEIEVTDDVTNVYYTTDGSVPDVDSYIYTGPIPLPIGNSWFKFMRIEAGICSNVTEVVYELELNTLLTPEDAEQIVIHYCLENGKLLYEAGKINDTGSVYSYQYQSVRNINGEGDFYIVTELMLDKEQNLMRTGTFFAVNIYSGELYRLQVDDFGYTLTKL